MGELRGRLFGAGRRGGPGGDAWTRGYMIAVSIGALAVLVRALLDPFLGSDHAFVLSLMAVVYVAWQCGFGPGLVTLLVSMAGTVFFFVTPRNSFGVENTSDHLAAAAFLFCGVVCAALGHSQRNTREQLKAALGDVLGQKAALEGEVEGRRRAEEGLRESEERFRSVFNQQFQFMAILDPDGVVLEINDLPTRATGIPRDQVVGRAFWDTPFWAGLPDVRAGWPGRLAAAARADGPVLSEDRYQTADGAVRAADAAVTAVRGPDGAVRFFIIQANDVTDRKRAEADLRDQQEQFRVMADSIPQLAWMARPDGHIFWYNRRWYEYTGTTFEQMEGWGWEDVHDPVELRRMLVTWRAALAAGTPWDDTFPLRRHDGQMRWHLSRAEPIRDAAGNVVRWFGTNTDITDRRQMELALAEQEARFRTLSEAVPQIVWVTRPDGYHEYYNAKWYEYTGRTEAESLGWGWATPLHPDDRGRSEAAWRQATETGTPYEVEYRFRRHDGEYRWFLGRALPQRDDRGRVVRWFGTCTDIDDFKLVEEKLRHAAERFRLLTEAVPQIVWNADAGGRASYFNTRWLEFTGMDVTAAADNWLSVIHPDDRDKVQAAWLETTRAAAAGTGDRFAEEFRLRNVRTGEYRWFLSVAVPLRRADGAIDQWIGSMADVTDQKEEARTLERLVRERTADLEAANAALVAQVEERRRAEEKVTAVARELRRSNGELEQFAYVASHDLQEPLRKIQAFGDLLRNKFADPLPPAGREYVQKMQGSAGRMSQLITDLLAFSRVTTHARPFARVDLSAVLRDVVDDLEVRIEQTGADVEVGPLPTVEADPSQMRQLFQNLLGNALKFHEPGVKPVVRVSGEEATERGPDGRPTQVGRVAVADNGIGFDEKYLGRIFQVFQRLHGKDEFDGTGVGLAICKKIADRHNGSVTARSRPGEGATFVVTLPVRQPDPVADLTATPVPTAPRPAIPT